MYYKISESSQDCNTYLWTSPVQGSEDTTVSNFAIMKTDEINFNIFQPNLSKLYHINKKSILKLFIYVKNRFSKPGMYLTLNLDYVHFKCSVATLSLWLLPHV